MNNIDNITSKTCFSSKLMDDIVYILYEHDLPKGLEVLTNEYKNSKNPQLKNVIDTYKRLISLKNNEKGIEYTFAQAAYGCSFLKFNLLFYPKNSEFKQYLISEKVYRFWSLNPKLKFSKITKLNFFEKNLIIPSDLFDEKGHTIDHIVGGRIGSQNIFNKYIDNKIDYDTLISLKKNINYGVTITKKENSQLISTKGDYVKSNIKILYGIRLINNKKTTEAKSFTFEDVTEWKKYNLENDNFLLEFQNVYKK